MPAFISFFSDFGLRDEYVGVCHGVIASLAPDVRIIDASHEIAQGQIRSGALSMLRSIQYLPEGVALTVVDPGVGTDRAAIAVETPWGFFVGPDNGVLSPAVAMVGGASRAVRLDNPEFHLPNASSTFHGRDIFSPAAALLASGQASLVDLGTELDPASLIPLLLPLAEIKAERVAGVVWWLDGFGNCQTNISPENLRALGITLGDQVVVRFGVNERTVKWVPTFGAGEPDELVLHTDSAGLLALAVVGGNAAEALQLEDDQTIQIWPS
jgi:S-adenosylmethionine hydrolase